MRKINKTVLNIILVVGLLFIGVGFLLGIHASSSYQSREIRITLFPLLVLFCGLMQVYVSIAFSHKTAMLYCGIDMIFCAAFLLLLVHNIIPWTISMGWPVFLILSGITLILACLYKHKKIRPSYLISAFVMVVLGVFFLLFSLDIIKVSFVKFISIAGPVLMVLAGLATIVLFLIQSKYKDLVLPEEEYADD